MTGTRLVSAAFVAAAALLSLAGSATAAAPVAVTGPVTSSGQTSATVSGTVDPGGQSTSWHVEYGTSTGYGLATTSVSAGSGSSATGVSATLGGLTPGTTYHYRVVATNTAGTSQGSDAVLTTSGAPAPAVATGPATGVSTHAATLTGTVNPNGRPTDFWFEYGTSTSYGLQTGTQGAGSGTSTVNASAAISGLTTGRTYHFRIVARSDGGTAHGGDQTFTPAAAPTVTTNGASSVTGTSARLNGHVDPNGQATSWHFEYGTSTSYGSSTAAKSAGSGTGTVAESVTVLGLAPGTSYHFRLVATSDAGTTAGADQTFTTTGIPGVSTGAAQNVATVSATLTGDVDPRTHTTTWWFEYGTTTRYGTRTPAQSAAANTGNRAVSAGIAGLAAGTTYHFRLVARNGAGTTHGADAAFTTTANTVSLATSTYQIVFGRFLMLSGNVSSGLAGVNVTVSGQRFGESAFSAVATVQTGSGGRWTYLAQPSSRTTYQVTANGVSSAQVTVGVRPAVSLRKITGARLSTRVRAGSSFAGRFVQLQRLVRGRWKTVKHARLNASSIAYFHASALPRGRSTIRIALSVNQAGPGYLAGFSRKLVYHRGR